MTHTTTGAASPSRSTKPNAASPKVAYPSAPRCSPAQATASARATTCECSAAPRRCTPKWPRWRTPGGCPPQCTAIALSSVVSPLKYTTVFNQMCAATIVIPATVLPRARGMSCSTRPLGEFIMHGSRFCLCLKFQTKAHVACVLAPFSFTAFRAS